MTEQLPMSARAKTERDRLRKDYRRTRAWLLAAADGDEISAALMAERLARWFAGEGGEPHNVERFKDVVRVFQGSEPTYMRDQEESTAS